MKEANHSRLIPIRHEQEVVLHTPLPYSWLLSSVLFFFIATMVAPQFWQQLSLATPGAKNLPANNALGFTGIIVYLLEPFTWHYYALRSKNETKKPVLNDSCRQSILVLLCKASLSLAAGIFIAVPYIFLLIFKPVLRALVLYTSLLYLGNMNEKSALYQFFVVTVSFDVIFYYLNLMAPKWKYNPGNAFSKFFCQPGNKVLINPASLLLVIHTAFIYTLLLCVVVYNAHSHLGKPHIGTLFLWWFILTVYIRASFSHPDNGYAFSFLYLSRVQTLINILALIISFIGFIWPFYFG